MNDNTPPTDTPLELKPHGDPAAAEHESNELKRDGWADYTLVFWLEQLQQSVIQQVTAASLAHAILGCASTLAQEYKLQITKIVPCAAFAGTVEPLSVAAAFGEDPKVVETLELVAEHVEDVPTIDLATTETKGTA